MEDRRSPEEILKRIEVEDKPEGRGELKIFFGFAAGVGKTYAMLDAAHTEVKNGTDVVAGYIEPHARPETIALLNGLEVLPPKQITYKGIVLNEFDLDAALLRKPELILVDELAHTNAEGCRHTKRYQDINELLEAGIDVYTTVNVQHLESLYDIVASITQVKVKERIPDAVFDNADQVELVDIEPEQLIHRLQEGKIYRKEQARRAAGHFFLKENLTALREIALRRTADRVNRKVMEERSVRDGASYFTSEKILICISPSPTNEKVIRTAARMANAFQAELIALHVETPEYEEADDKSKRAVYNHMKLAKEFGAKVAVVSGENVPHQIAEYAKSSGISKIVIGKTGSTRGRLRFWKPGLIDKLISAAPNLDVYVIPDQPSVKLQKKLSGFHKLTWADAWKSIGILAACTGIGEWIYVMELGNISIGACFIAGTVLTAWVTGKRFWTCFAAFVGVALYNLFFTVPRMTLNAYNPIYPFTFLVLFFISLLTGELTVRLRRQERQEFLKSRRMEILLNTSHKLRRTNGAEEIIECCAGQILDLLGCSISIYKTFHDTFPDNDFLPETLHPSNMNENQKKETEEALLAEDEQAVAEWVRKCGHRAGRTTDTLPGAFAYYVPVSGEKQVFAVYGIALGERERMNAFDKNILKAIINETAFATEKYVLLEKQKLIRLNMEKEKLRSHLLRAVSHDLRTPISSITGYSSMLLTEGDKLNGDQKQTAYENLYEESLWLNSMVENLLLVTKLDEENGLQKKSYYLSDIIAEACKYRDGGHHKKIRVNLPEAFVVQADARMISRVLINMLDNSIRYTPKDSEIIISAMRKGADIAVEVADNGPGISDEEKEKIFDLYFTCEKNNGDSRRGLGLGLSLCKTIMEAHDGSIYVRDNQPAGAVFGFTLREGNL